MLALQIESVQPTTLYSKPKKITLFGWVSIWEGKQNRQKASQFERCQKMYKLGDALDSISTSPHSIFFSDAADIAAYI